MNVSPDQARQAIDEPVPPPSIDDILEAWTEGYLSGLDQGASGTETARSLRDAETLAELDRASWVPVGKVSRDRRMAREMAEMEAMAIEVRQADDWPMVRMPGSLDGSLDGSCERMRPWLDQGKDSVSDAWTLPDAWVRTGGVDHERV